MNWLKELAALVDTLIILCLIFVPLGLWKLVEIVIWVWSHLSWN